MSRKAAVQCMDQIRHWFPDARAGVWNCRRIAGSTKWSQHAWGGALDLYHKDYGYSDAQAHQDYLDEIARWLEDHKADLSIRLILWQVKNHYNHIHVDFWWHNIGTPPCADGQLMQVSSKGSLVEDLDMGPENGYIEGYLPGPKGLQMPTQQWHAMIDSLFEGRPDEFQGDPNYWKQLDPDSAEWRDFFAAFTRAITP